MPCVKILETGRLDSRDSAFPQAVQLPDGDVLCSFGVGGGPNVGGGTELARSTDGGRTWANEGFILPPTDEPRSTNALKLSISPDGRTVYAYGSRYWRSGEQGFGEGRNEAVLCISTDSGHSWSAPRVVPMPADCPLEISHGVLALDSGRALAPAAVLPDKDHLAERVLLAISDDGGETWPRHAVAFEDPEKRRGFFEHKFAQVAPGRLIGVCWTVTLGDVSDLPNSFAMSDDNGATWSPPRSTGIMGQTMTPIPLGGDRLLVLYNRRYGDQGVVMSLVTFTDRAWETLYENMMYDARAKRERPRDVESGVQEFDEFAFGFPTAIRLRDGAFLATHWRWEDGAFGIHWTRLRVEW